MSDDQRSWENFGARRPMRAASARAAAPGFRLSGMSDTVRRIVIIAVGLTGSVLLAATIIWGMSRMGPRTVPVIEADARPFRVRPEGLPVTPPVPASQQARVMPAPEAPRTDALRQQMQPPAPAVVPGPAPATVAPVAVAPPGRTAAPRQAGPVPNAAAPATAPVPAARPVPAAGRSAVQLSAAATEDAARAEWERLRRRAPELASMTPRITRLDREGREPLWRLRVGGLADPAAARTLCEQLRTRGVACNPV